MAKQIADVQIHAPDSNSSYAEDLDISVDLIDERLYLGNLACARDYNTLRKLQITHVLTVDLVPLPLSILDRSDLIFRFLKLADVPKEDLITQLPSTNEFIKEAINDGGTVLVHCYFGVSRSAAVVVAYVMEKYQLCYEDALATVRSHRRFVSPNLGFAAQLKLFGHMGYCLNREDPRYKQFRLKMAGQKLKQLKILPQLFADLIKPDPGLVRERPEPVVYRCKRCRRVVASQRNLIPHIPKEVKIELAKKGMRPPPSKLTGLHCAENGQVLIEKLKSLACQIMDATTEPEQSSTGKSDEVSDNESSGQSQRSGSNVADSDEGPSQKLDDYYAPNVCSATTTRGSAACRAMWFVEPMAWMRAGGVDREPQGKLHCPKCSTKIGSFNWVMGCRCPCGQKVAPAFYLVPSKVEWSNIVQNVQSTV